MVFIPVPLCRVNNYRGVSRSKTPLRAFKRYVQKQCGEGFLPALKDGVSAQGAIR